MWKGYIYVIRNTINSKVYIGQTTQPEGRRFKQHLYGNEKGKLNNAIKKYGKDKFYEDQKKLFVIVSSDLVILKEQLDFYEMYFIEVFNSIKNGYNTVIGGKGNKQSPENLKYSIDTSDTKLYNQTFRINNLEKRKEQHKVWVKNNPDRVKELQHKWYENHKEECKDRCREYYAENSDKIKKQQAEYRENNHEEYLANAAKYREKNKETINQKKREFAKEHPEKIKEWSHTYYENNKDKILQKQRERNHRYYEDNKDKILQRQREQRARKRLEKQNQNV